MFNFILSDVICLIVVTSSFPSSEQRAGLSDWQKSLPSKPPTPNCEDALDDGEAAPRDHGLRGFGTPHEDSDHDR